MTNVSPAIVSFYTSDPELSSSLKIADVISEFTKIDQKTARVFIRNQFKRFEKDGQTFYSRTKNWYYLCSQAHADELLDSSDLILERGYQVRMFEIHTKDPDSTHTADIFVHPPPRRLSRDEQEEYRQAIQHRVHKELERLKSLGIFTTPPRFIYSTNWNGQVKRGPMIIRFDPSTPLNIRRFTMTVLNQSYVSNDENKFVCFVGCSWLLQK